MISLLIHIWFYGYLIRKIECRASESVDITISNYEDLLKSVSRMSNSWLRRDGWNDVENKVKVLKSLTSCDLWIRLEQYLLNE